MVKNKLFLAIAIVFSLWNLMGLGMFINDVLHSADTAYAAMGKWNWLLYGIGTWGAFASAIGVLFNKPWALRAMIASALAVMVQYGMYASQRPLASMEWVVALIVFVQLGFTFWARNAGSQA
jgi:hypothetical protein